MWKITLFFNLVVLVLFWLLAQVVITPIHNLLVQYAETGVDLPILTDFAIRMRTPSMLIPIAWAILTLVAGRQMRGRTAEIRQDRLSAHSSITLCIGLCTLIFFALAAILPILKIGAAIH
jgi:hypothetical protein